jgi:hypothetical protein
VDQLPFTDQSLNRWSPFQDLCITDNDTATLDGWWALEINRWCERELDARIFGKLGNVIPELCLCVTSKRDRDPDPTVRQEH